MAVRRKKKKDGFGRSIGVSGAKYGGALACGAAIGAARAAGGERMGHGVKAVMGIGGIAGDVLLDRDENPIAKQAAESMLAVSGGSVGENLAFNFTSSQIEKNRERRRKEDLDQLRADMMAEEDKVDEVQPTGQVLNGVMKPTDTEEVTVPRATTP